MPSHPAAAGSWSPRSGRCRRAVAHLCGASSASPRHQYDPGMSSTLTVTRKTNQTQSAPDIETSVLAFIQRWQGVTASELSTAQSFVIELCRLLDVPPPHPTPEQDYMFERPIIFQHGDGSTSCEAMGWTPPPFNGISVPEWSVSHHSIRKERPSCKLRQSASTWPRTYFRSTVSTSTAGACFANS